MSRYDDPDRVHECTVESHAEFGVHMHEVEPGRWRLFEVRP